jgi:hypothetical protein
MSDVRPLPKSVLMPDWFWVVLVVSAVAGSIFTQSVWFVIGLISIVVAQGIYLFGIARCPVCSRKFSFHRGDVPGHSTKYLLQLECKQCHIIWDTGRIRDDDEFFNS